MFTKQTTGRFKCFEVFVKYSVPLTVHSLIIWLKNRFPGNVDYLKRFWITAWNWLLFLSFIRDLKLTCLCIILYIRFNITDTWCAFEKIWHCVCKVIVSTKYLLMTSQQYLRFGNLVPIFISQELLIRRIYWFDYATMFFEIIICMGNYS